MVKKVRVDQLKPGMFVHDFNSGWLHHPFLTNRVLIKSERDIARILKQRIREVYIDTAKGLDVDDAPTGQEVARQLQAEMDGLALSSETAKDSECFKKEFSRAKLLVEKLKETARRLMDAVRQGQPLDYQLVNTAVDHMTESVLTNKDALISLLRIKNRDEYTYLHSLAVSALCISFARHLGFDDAQVKELGIGGLLHDIGKVKIPGEILNKPGPLTEAEFELMKTHVWHGCRILRETTAISENSIKVSAQHHERLDGTGYPEGLKGDQIGQLGQMAAIVDIYDALTSERCYKNSIPPPQALRKLYEWSDAHLNRTLVEQFIAQVGIYPLGTLVRLRSGFLGVVVDHGDRNLLRPTVRAVYDTRKHSFVRPFDLNLSRKAAEDGIVGCESPERWHFHPEIYLTE